MTGRRRAEPRAAEPRAEEEKLRRSLAAVCLFCLALFPAILPAPALCQQGRRPPDEKTIRDGDQVWAHAIEAKDLDQVVSFYADDASVLPFNAPIVTGGKQIRQLWSRWLSTPGFSLRLAPSNVEVARSGDLAYELGTFELTMNDAGGKRTTQPGKYVVVWKQAGGQWKAAADIFNTDTPGADGPAQGK